MPLTIGPHTITIIKEDGKELKYGTKDYIGCDTMQVKLKYNNLNVSSSLHRNRLDDFKNVYHNSNCSIYLMLPDDGMILKVSDLFTLRICTTSSYAATKYLYNYSYYNYFSGLNITSYCSDIPKARYLLIKGEDIDQLINLVLIASQLDISLVDTLFAKTELH